MEQLSGKVAVITGAGSGIGRALARAFGAEGMRLMLADIDPEGLDETAAELRAAGHEVTRSGHGRGRRGRGRGAGEGDTRCLWRCAPGVQQRRCRCRRSGRRLRCRSVEASDRHRPVGRAARLASVLAVAHRARRRPCGQHGVGCRVVRAPVHGALRSQQVRRRGDLGGRLSRSGHVRARCRPLGAVPRLGTNQHRRSSESRRRRPVDDAIRPWRRCSAISFAGSSSRAWTQTTWPRRWWRP